MPFSPSKITAPAPPDDADHRPRASLHTLGCRLNLAESDVLRRQLEGAGYQVVPWGEAAEVCVVNTCTVTSQADAKSRQTLRSVRRNQPEALLAVTGCFAQLHGEELAGKGMAHLVVGNGDKLSLVAHLGEITRNPPEAGAARVIAPRLTREPFAIQDFAPGELELSGGGTRVHLKVQDGCDFMCSFCIIPTARGRARPRRMDNLLAEAERLTGAGARELVLTGVNVGTFGDTAGGARGGLVDMVDALDALGGLARIRIGSIEPATVEAGLLERMADPSHRLVPFLHLPLQSGSGAILRAMRRRYTPQAYRAFAEQALARVPELCLGTDVMTGFPGEDDEAFGETVAFLQGLPFAYFHVFPYSLREGTAACRLPGVVPVPVRKRRAALLRRMSEQNRAAFHRRFVGRTMEVLFEQPRSPGVAQGVTANYIRVDVPAPQAAALRNRILPVRLLEGGPSRMAGELVSPLNAAE